MCIRDRTRAESACEDSFFPRLFLLRRLLRLLLRIFPSGLFLPKRFFPQRVRIARDDFLDHAQLRLAQMCIRDRYYAPNYPTDSSNINMLVAASDTALAMKLYTSDMLKMTLDQSLSDAFNTTVAIEFDQFEYTEVAGQPALHMVFHYTVSEIDIVTAQYVINAGDSSCTLALAQMPGSEWLDAFDASVAALAIVPAE